MRNKGAFIKPQIQNSYKKSQRNYPQPKNIYTQKIQERNQQQTKKPPQKKRQQVVYNATSRLSPIIVSHGNRMRFHFAAQNPFPIQPKDIEQLPIIDPTCLWYKYLENSVFQKKKRFIQFGNMEYVLSNWTGDKFPSTIFITLDGYIGFYDIDSMITDRVAALNLQDISPTIDDSNVRTYDLRYVMPGNYKWQLPPQITFIKLRVKVDDDQNPLQLPLPNPISVQLQISFQ